MKKSAIAIAITVLGATSGVAQAQSNVTIYGVADTGLVHERGGPAGNRTAMHGGVASGSRLGFRGKEDLGGGLFANFVLESGINLDNGSSGQGGVLYGRQSFVGLSGNFGALTMGRQYSPYYKVLRDVADPFAAGLAGRAGNIMTTNARTNNMIEYVMPKLGGFFADVAYGFGEVPGMNSASRTVSAAVGYQKEAVNVKLAHHQLNNATGTDKARNTLLAGRYNFGIATASLGYAVNKGTGTADSRDLIGGVIVPFGNNRVIASYIRRDDKAAANRDASQWAVGYFYSLSKRTSLYGSYAKISNKNGATFKVGNASDSGTGDSAINLGVRHSF